MRKTTTALSVLAIALASVAAPAIAQTPAPLVATETDQNAAIMAFFEEQDAEQLTRSPLSKSFRGIKDADYGQWDDFSDEAAARANDASQSALKEMRARFDTAKLSPENRLSFRLFEKQAALAEAAYKYNDYGYVFDQMNGAQSQIPSPSLSTFIALITRPMPALTSDRLYGIGPADGAMRSCQARIARRAKGIMPPKWVYPYVINDSRNVITGAPFGEGPDAPLFRRLQGEGCSSLPLPRPKRIC